MQRLFFAGCLAFFLTMMVVGCASQKLPFITYSTDVGDMTVYPTTQGPVDTFRPIYTVDNSKRIFGSGKSWNEDEATKMAIYDACARANCDYIAAAKRVTKVTSVMQGAQSYEVTVIGYPVTITGVEQVPVVFYERQADGSLKKLDHPEHRIVFDPMGVGSKVTTTKDDKGNVVTKAEPVGTFAHWVPAMLPGVEMPARGRLAQPMEKNQK